MVRLSTKERVLENRVRRMAQRQGLRLIKSRRRDPQALDFGSYVLVDIESNSLVFGDQFGATLDEVAEWLLGRREGQSP